MDLALRVALQTMKERCQDLQKRNNVLEQENQHFRNLDISQKLQSKALNNTRQQIDKEESRENMELKMQVAELQRHNAHLNENFNMVSKENRNLWSRLSQISKEQQETSAATNYCDKNKESGENIDSKTMTRTSVGNMANVSNSQNLIRSKTFTKHSPNPQLRSKNTANIDLCSDIQGLSLDDIVLNEADLDNSTLCTKSEASQNINKPDLGLSYFNIDDGSVDVAASPVESEKENLGVLQEIKNEALKQRQDMQIVLGRLQKKLASNVCPDCILRSKKPEMADKSLETDESLHEIVLTNTKGNKVKEEGEDDGIGDGLATNISSEINSKDVKENKTDNGSTAPTTNHINFIQEKIDADNMIKTCPVCGRIFSEYVKFQHFLEHVESHFIGDTSDLGSSLNFEYISHTVGDF